MAYPILEARHAVIAAGVLALLWLIGHRARFSRQRGWSVLLAGCCLIVLAAAVDAAAILSPARSSAVRGPAAQDWLSRGVAYLPGLCVAAAGLLLWLPVFTRSQREHAALERSHTRLRTRHAESTAECRALSEQLEQEVGRRRQAEEALAAAVDEARQREKEVSALLLAACGVLEHKSLDYNARALFEACRNLTGGTAGYVALSPPSGGDAGLLLVDVGHGPQAADAPMPMVGLCGDVYRNGRAAFANLPSDRDRPLLPGAALDVDNVLCAPILAGGRVAGLLCMVNKPGGFDGRDVSLVEAFADLAALGLSNPSS